MIEKPGIYADIQENEYHADPVGPSPSLSSSIAKILVTRSPRHAWLEHPRLNPEKAAEVEAPTRAQDIGTASHKMILGEGKVIETLDFNDYKGGDARKARDAARAAGRVPLLTADMDKATALAKAARAELVGTELEGVFDAGTPEATIVWQDAGGIWCRSRIDYLPDAVRQGGHVIVPDVKTTGGSAHPDDWQRAGFDLGANIQAAFYERGLRALIPSIRTVAFRFAVIEQDAPHAVSVCGMGGQAMEEARQLVELAMQTWAACMKSGTWPGYPKHTAMLDPPVYYSRVTEIRRLSLLQRLADWQAPHDKVAA